MPQVIYALATGFLIMACAVKYADDLIKKENQSWATGDSIGSTSPSWWR